ncbi:MAG: hypothetical protein EA398_07725 [Deltaproteobacteria bacterium]|nr:MAG: hypothetical protein EA398_07725 [Deltaproteobacteria bacterium]
MHSFGPGCCPWRHRPVRSSNTVHLRGQPTHPRAGACARGLMSESSAPLHVVWIKRDARIHDHPALTAACAQPGEVAALCVFEPSLWGSPEHDALHLHFVLDGLRELRERLEAIGVPLLLRVGELPEAFADLHAARPISGLWAHEETGNRLTYDTHLRVHAVDHRTACREAKSRVVAWKGRPEVREAAREVYRRHGSRKRPQERRQGGEPGGSDEGVVWGGDSVAGPKRTSTACSRPSSTRMSFPSACGCPSRVSVPGPSWVATCLNSMTYRDSL